MPLLAGGPTVHGNFATIALVSVLGSAGATLVDADDTFARNVEFLLRWLDRAPETPVEDLHGATMSLREALDVAAVRAGDVDLSLFVRPQRAAAPDATGDVWILERGEGPCTHIHLADQPVEVPAWPIVWLHDGYVGEVRTRHGWSTSVVSWTTGEHVMREHTGGFTAVGSIDPYCVAFEDGHFAFPFVTGIGQINA